MCKLLRKCLLFPLAAVALQDPPEFARGGRGFSRDVRNIFVAEGAARVWDAPVDHGSPERGTFAQRYFVDARFYDAARGGPVFLQLGGEGAVTGPPAGFVAELAEARGALLVAVEHRFYGESIPLGNLETETLRLLTVDQALADYAAFVEWFTAAELRPRAEPGAALDWFIFGGSYPGALAAWFMVDYGHLAKGALSSSGVVNAIYDFPAFDTHVAAAMGEACAGAVREATTAFEGAILGGDAATAAHAKGLFGLRGDLWDPDFFYMLADGLAMMVQYGAKSVLCSNATAFAATEPTAGELLENTAALVLDYWGPDFGKACFYDTACLADPTRLGMDRSWRWQKCSELAYLQSAPPEGSLRSRVVSLDYCLEQCRRIFGADNADPSTAAINRHFGGARPVAEHVFFSDFSDDPWAEASVQQNLPNEPFRYAECDDCGHCKDLHASTPDDPEPIKELRADFETYLDVWLAATPSR